MSFTFLNQLPSPAEIKRDFPLSEELKQLKKKPLRGGAEPRLDGML